MFSKLTVLCLLSPAIVLHAQAPIDPDRVAVKTATEVLTELVGEYDKFRDEMGKEHFTVKLQKRRSSS